MSNIDNAIRMSQALNKAGTMNTLSIKIVLHVYAMGAHPLVGEIAKDLKTSAPGITRTIDKLEKRGLVKRKREEKDDKRKVKISMTPKGTAFVEKMFAA